MVDLEMQLLLEAGRLAASVHLTFVCLSSLCRSTGVYHDVYHPIQYSVVNGIIPPWISITCTCHIVHHFDNAESALWHRSTSAAPIGTICNPSICVHYLLHAPDVKYMQVTQQWLVLWPLIHAGIGLAHICNSLGYKCVIYMPDTQSKVSCFEG